MQYVVLCSSTVMVDVICSLCFLVHCWFTLHRYHNEAAKCRQKLQEAIKKWRAGRLLTESL